MRILLTVHQFFPAFSAGTEVLTLSVARELRSRGHEVYLFTAHPSNKTLADNLRFDRYSVEEFPVFRFHHAYVPMGGQQVLAELEYDNRLAARYFDEVLREVSPDVVHFFHLNRLGTGLIDLAVAAGIPAYYTPTDFWAICPLQQLMLEDGRPCAGPSSTGGNCVKHVAIRTSSPRAASAMRWVPDRAMDFLTAAAARGRLPGYRAVKEAAAMSARRGVNTKRMNALQRIFAPTRLVAESLVGSGVDPSRVYDVAYGIDTSNFEKRDPYAQPIGEALRVGFIGTLAAHKGCHVLVDAFRRLSPAAARLDIYGDLTQFPAYCAELQSLAAGMEAIRFHGTFPHSALPEVLAAIDVLVVPSLWHENTPLVVYAALAAGCPVVASDYRGISEVITHEYNGLLCPAGDVEKLRGLLERLIENRDLLSEWSANCQPPKSIMRYVSELLDAYRADRLAAAGRPNGLDDQS